MSFDDLQGEDPDALQIRDHIPEPSRVENHYWTVITPPKTPFIFSQFDSDIGPDMMTTNDRIEFQKVRYRYPGVEFCVWKCLKDGKLYF